ncbi:MAG: helicase-associated domain-containing protein [Nocardioidaceae bacterium]|nr:helicase-associated domain-containing protein [Nocardioidaceae bacterium]
MSPQSDSPRTLTQMLRDWDDATLTRLLMARPDLADPPPTDYSQIASRSTTRHSVSQSLDLLTAFEPWVARRVCDLGGTSEPSGSEALDATTFAQAVAGGPVDSNARSVADVPDTSDISAALDRLLSLGLLWGDASSLRPVRAMASSLTAGDPGIVPASRPPGFQDAAQQPGDLVDKVAAGSAFELVRRIDVLVEHCDHSPASLVKSGELASRETRTFGSLLDLPAPIAGIHLKIARAAGLLGTLPGSELKLVPTYGFDDWQSLSLAAQWQLLAAAWLHQHETPANAWLTRHCLQGLASAGDYVAGTPEQLHSWVSWQRPRRAPATARPIISIIDQAAWVGVTGLGALSSFGAALVAAILETAPSPAPASAPSTLESLLPPRVDHVMVQADLTAIAPGPLEAEAARDLGSLADVESRGGATVYRFSPASLQRAYRLGWRVPDIVSTLEKRSTTPLPQPLLYLVHDLERLPPPGRVAKPDPQTPAGGSPLHASPLRALGCKAELSAKEELTFAAAQRLVQGLRHTEVDPSPDESPRPQTSNRIDSPLDTLREAVETGEVVWFGYVDTRGASGERLVVAKSVGDGRLQARDSRTDEALTVPLHRITSAHIIRRTA